jgi:hypothetical protein
MRIDDRELVGENRPRVSKDLEWEVNLEADKVTGDVLEAVDNQADGSFYFLFFYFGLGDMDGGVRGNYIYWAYIVLKTISPSFKLPRPFSLPKK